LRTVASDAARQHAQARTNGNRENGDVRQDVKKLAMTCVDADRPLAFSSPGVPRTALMARQSRDDAPGVAHHIMIRGIERRAIFWDDADREDLLRRLAKLALELGFVVFAWVFMPNHVHVVVRSAHARISTLMARLGTGYARRFNERHERVGHLFQNRFRSRRVVDDADLIGLVLYVVRNPLEAGLVADGAALEDFPWCSLGALLGRRASHPFEAVDQTLALFDPDPLRAMARVREWLGTRAATEQARMPTGAPRPVPASHTNFDQLLLEVAARHAVPPERLRSRGRTAAIAAARRELALRAAAELGLSGAEIGRRLGLTRAAVSLLLARGCSHPTS
jgi:putative transposase